MPCKMNDEEFQALKLIMREVYSDDETEHLSEADFEHYAGVIMAFLYGNCGERRPKANDGMESISVDQVMSAIKDTSLN